jgi:hypothetical protein
MKSILDFDINSLKLSSSVLSVSSSLLQTSVFRFNFNFDIKILVSFIIFLLNLDILKFLNYRKLPVIFVKKNR